MRIDEAITTIRSRLPDPGKETVDTVKAGDTSAELTGIVMSFMGTGEVLAAAASAGANLVISHEPVFYSHLDKTDWLTDDPVFARKKATIESEGLVIVRLHDAMHRIPWPDYIDRGMLSDLGWTDRVDTGRPRIVHLDGQRLDALVSHCVGALGCTHARAAGDPSMMVRTVACSFGAAGGRTQMSALQQPDVDVVICGESAEWETCEYVRDAAAAGMSKGLIVLGHAASEEAGMRHFVDDVRSWLPGVNVQHVPAGSALWPASS